MCEIILFLFIVLKLKVVLLNEMLVVGLVGIVGWVVCGVFGDCGWVVGCMVWFLIFLWVVLCMLLLLFW